MDDRDDRFRDTFPDADELARWHRLTPAEQEAEFEAAIAQGLEGPAAPVRTKDEIIAAVLARYAVEA